MKKFQFTPQIRQRLADLVTPVGVYLKIRDQYPNSILLESSDYHGNENSFSFICFDPVAEFMVDGNMLLQKFPDGTEEKSEIIQKSSIVERLNEFVQSFSLTKIHEHIKINGLFGYNAYDAVEFFESIQLQRPSKEEYKIPEIRYQYYRFIVAINHFKNEMYIVENLMENENSDVEKIETLLNNNNFATFRFAKQGTESSNMNEMQYKELVAKGKEHCFRGDVFQIVLSRQFSQKFSGDEFNVYRALRSINPSPYLFYYDFGAYKIFGSSPEAQLIIEKNKAIINPIAGTFRRTGDDEKDKALAEELTKDKKENAEHVMLVDLARNDLSRNSQKVKVETYREVQYYSHVLHLVSKVSGMLDEGTNVIKVMADTFPAGTLSGAPKFKAMELINKYEPQGRGYYGGSIGYIGFDGSFNQAIMIRSFLSKENCLYYQAGAGIVSESVEESELSEVNNKLAALKKAIEIAENI